MLALYIHIPFCERKCPYCDFNTYAGLQSYQQSLVDALCLELRHWAEQVEGRPITSIFLGGGTPTILEDRELSQIFSTVYDAYQLADSCEITCEANPGTVDRRKFGTLRKLGVNRLSMGVQSFQPAELTFLGRIHTVDDVYQAFEAARAAGFENINLDFMFGLPEQTEGHWQDTMEKAVALQTEHLSLYSLIVEPQTPLHHWVEMGQVMAPDEDLAARHYEMAMTQLGKAGYVQYEISNWAKPAGEVIGQTAVKTVVDRLNPAFACQHNLLYWRNQEYIGIGPGAHSHLQYRLMHDIADGNGVASNMVNRRWGNRKAVQGYIKRINSGETVEDFGETIDDKTAMGETMMLGLRLLDEGVSFDLFQTTHQQDLRDVFATELAYLNKHQLLQSNAERVQLSERGLMVGNQVFMQFL